MAGGRRLRAGVLAAGALAAGVLAAGTRVATASGAARAAPHRHHGLVAGRVTAVGDSVMLDYAADLRQDVPDVRVYAAVSEQWDAGVATVRSLRASGELGDEAVVDLGTNGPVSPAQLDAMATALSGLRRVVLVTVHVDRPWQGEVNATLEAAVRAMPNARIADWNRLVSGHPDWLGSDGTHMPIGGPGAQALAALVARTLEDPAG